MDVSKREVMHGCQNDVYIFGRDIFWWLFQKSGVAMGEIVDSRQASPQALETISKYFGAALVQDTFFGAAHDTLQELGFKR